MGFRDRAIVSLFFILVLTSGVSASNNYSALFQEQKKVCDFINFSIISPQEQAKLDGEVVDKINCSKIEQYSFTVEEASYPTGPQADYGAVVSATLKIFGLPIVSSLLLMMIGLRSRMSSKIMVGYLAGGLATACAAWLSLEVGQVSGYLIALSCISTPIFWAFYREQSLSSRFFRKSALSVITSLAVLWLLLGVSGEVTSLEPFEQLLRDYLVNYG